LIVINNSVFISINGEVAKKGILGIKFLDSFGKVEVVGGLLGFGGVSRGKGGGGGRRGAREVRGKGGRRGGAGA